MIHFVLTFSNDARNSPFAQALSTLGVDYKIFSEKILLRYRYRIWLLLAGWPKLAWFAARMAWRSMIHSKPKPDVVVLGTHIEALIFGLVRALIPAKKPRLYLLGFIYTSRKNRHVDLIRKLYFTTVFSFLNGVICHSTKEQEDYSRIFKRSRAKFIFVPYGLHLHGHEKYANGRPLPATSEVTPYAFSAGRSGRDYKTLFEAFAKLGLPLHVICDSEAALMGCTQTGKIEVLRSCYDDCYFNQLKDANLVVVPIAVDDISAGQMVMIQAMAFHKPIILTRTPTITDYVQHDEEVYLVPPGDPQAIIDAVMLLDENPGVAAQLAHKGYQAYVNKYSMPAYVKHIVTAVQA